MKSLIIFNILFCLTNAIPHELLTNALEKLESFDEPKVSHPTQSYGPSYTHTDQTPKPYHESYERIEETIHKRPSKSQTVIIEGGKLLSEAITAKIVGPVVIFNSKVAAAAGALPPLLAAKGAVIGSAIATPIEIGAVAGSSIASAVTGKLVAIPISVAAGAAAKMVGAAEVGKEVFDDLMENGGEMLKDGAIKLGHIIIKPIAIVVGAHTALTGAGLGLVGTGIKGVGVGLTAVGSTMMETGAKAKGLGAYIIATQFMPIPLDFNVNTHEIENQY